VGNVSILNSRALQATKGLSSALPAEETAGTISVNANGSATVKSVKGKITLMNKEHVVLAALSSKDSITIPSTTVGGKPVMVAQVGEVAAGAGVGTALGMSATTLAILAGGIVALGGSVWAVSAAGSDSSDHTPVCP
jgi:hypothetical protein